ncbi:MAG: YiiX/YebB-like N1pC/P60 family cysteine hydrolase [Bacteroidota bacterium]|nr:YiiX/YebB-like N1pC/P60 family cysteine hydrolase [Bacteroidota bacterium]
MKRTDFFFLSLLFLWVACRPVDSSTKNSLSPALLTAAFKSIDSSKSLIQNGDIVFRNGRDEVSQAARSMNRKDTSFSHCGLVFIEQDSVFVYHALGGVYNPGSKLKRELLDSFCTPKENNAYGLYRYNLGTAATKKLKQVVDGYYKAGLKFDLFFNFFSDDVMYCSEFVFKSLNQSANGAFMKYVRLDTMPYGVTTDDIFLNENCRLVQRKQFDR